MGVKTKNKIFTIQAMARTGITLQHYGYNSYREVQIDQLSIFDWLNRCLLRPATDTPTPYYLIDLSKPYWITRFMQLFNLLQLIPCWNNNGLTNIKQPCTGKNEFSHNFWLGLYATVRAHGYRFMDFS
eukprot:264190_1